ncbi:uncharacterized protein DS421_5g144230 [Arachis hypogaea]|nr:uncharacterized protein DS421_5g144230 [Arachis hypogaea]
MSTDDDEENEPIAKRMCRLFNQGVDQQKPCTETTDGNLNQDNTPHETPVSRVPDAGTLFVHPLLKERKLDENNEERLRRWAANGSLEKRQVVVSYEGRQHLVLFREDICTLLPRRWVNSNIIQWMCSTFNDSASLRFKDDFYCIPPRILEIVLQKRNLDFFREVLTMSYVGLGPQFGDDSRYFDKIAASMRKWWFVPVCIDCHWWLYAFEIAQKRLWVLDTAFQGRIIEDIAKVSMPAYEPMENGQTRFYPSIPKQHNGSVEMTPINNLTSTSLKNDT